MCEKPSRTPLKPLKKPIVSNALKKYCSGYYDKCERCGKELEENEKFELDDSIYCEECYNDEIEEQDLIFLDD